jgi:hypothetical protein
MEAKESVTIQIDSAKYLQAIVKMIREAPNRYLLFSAMPRLLSEVFGSEWTFRKYGFEKLGDFLDHLIDSQVGEDAIEYAKSNGVGPAYVFMAKDGMPVINGPVQRAAQNDQLISESGLVRSFLEGPWRQKWFNLETGEVVHFSIGENRTEDDRRREMMVMMDITKYIQIMIINRKDQMQWARSFLNAYAKELRQEIDYVFRENKLYSQTFHDLLLVRLERLGLAEQYLAMRFMKAKTHIFSWAERHNLRLDAYQLYKSL